MRRYVFTIMSIGCTLTVASLGLLSTQHATWAHGGTPKLTSAIVGLYVVSVWTQPEPPRVGRIHVSVAVMDPQDRSPILDARVRVAAEPLQDQKNFIASNANSRGILYDTDLQIPNAGPWRITLQVAGKAGNGSTDFELDVTPPPKVNWPVVGAILVLAVLAILTAFRVVRRIGLTSVS